MLARMRDIAFGLYSLGVRAGDRVAILSESCPEWVLADGGCQFAGAIDVPIYPTLMPSQVRYIMQDDARQSPLATRLVESLSAAAPGFVPLVSVVELGWVLSSAYGLERSQLAAALEG